MDFVLGNGVLTLFLSGRLDTEKSYAIETEIDQICATNEHERVVLDAADVEFIASSGLRVVLKTARREKNFSLINVSPQVYNVFEMTGFAKIIHIEKALRRINLDECELLGQGGNGAIYRISEDEIVKVKFNPDTFQDSEIEIARAKEAFLLGVPTPISFDVVDCGEGRRGLVYETIKSITLGETIEQQPERLEELVAQYITQLNALHAIHTDNPVFGSAKEDYCKQVKDASQYLTEEEGAQLQQIIDLLPEGDCLVHCDAHPKNLMIRDDEMYWIDMEKISLGHPIYDLISIAVVMKGMSTHAELAMKITGMSLPVLERVKDSFIRQYFKTDDAETVKQYDNIFNNLRLLRSVLAIGLKTQNSEKYRPAIIDMARQVFFPNVSGIMEGIKLILKQI